MKEDSLHHLDKECQAYQELMEELRHLLEASVSKAMSSQGWEEHLYLRGWCDALRRVLSYVKEEIDESRRTQETG